MYSDGHFVSFLMWNSGLFYTAVFHFLSKGYVAEPSKQHNYNKSFLINGAATAVT